jgi:hypothetical protein
MELLDNTKGIDACIENFRYLIERETHISVIYEVIDSIMLDLSMYTMYDTDFTGSKGSLRSDQLYYLSKLRDLCINQLKKQ